MPPAPYPRLQKGEAANGGSASLGVEPVQRGGDIVIGWTDKEKAALLEHVREHGSDQRSFGRIARKLEKSVPHCRGVYRALTEYAALGEVKRVVENGIMVFKCPPAFAHGVWREDKVKPTKGAW